MHTTYIHICMNACTDPILPIYVAKCILIYSIYAYTYMHGYIHVSIEMYVCNICIYVQTYKYICLCMSAYVHIFTYI